MINITELGISWLEERNMLDLEYNQLSLIGYLTEEITEGIRDTDEHESVDWRADCLVFLIHSLIQDGYNPEKVLSEAYTEINSRRGNYNKEVGKFIKEITGNEYTARYDRCKL